jgi:hypothetical protein
MIRMYDGMTWVQRARRDAGWFTAWDHFFFFLTLLFVVSYWAGTGMRTKRRDEIFHLSSRSSGALCDGW